MMLQVPMTNGYAISPHPVDCPEWDYERFSNSEHIVGEQCARVLVKLRRGQIDTSDVATDTRSVHKQVFSSLTTSEHSYFAGHYRGESFRCLQHYEVGIPSDSSVGFDARTVLGFMGETATLVAGTLASLDGGHEVPDAHLSQADKVLYTVAAACRIFELVLHIHPYANGNGHAARFLIWAILGRYGYWPNKWSLDHRPPDPPYTELIVRYRKGDKQPLERFVLHCIDGK